jgi:excinuclease ABC subunit B
VDQIKIELDQQLSRFREEGKLLEAQRLSARTRYDIEMMIQVGHCPGIENYSRHLSGRKEGERPSTLYDFFPKDFLLLVDESHVTVPQIRAMYAGDRSRKTTLVEHGFRLPSALDNRPLQFPEWESMVGNAVFVSATPSDYELKLSGGEVIEQVIRPTGLLDPVIELQPARGQVKHLLGQIRERAAVGERVLVTALTKRLAEDLANYINENGVACKWLHSELNAFERVALLQELRQGEFEALVGVNLLREGLDLPEVSLVAILDADKEGFLRSETSLVQTIGRAARNVNAKVILYADSVTESMRLAIEETERRRDIQESYNIEHGITPASVKKSIRHGIDTDAVARRRANELVVGQEGDRQAPVELLAELEKEMFAAAEALDFERAAGLRDQILKLRGEPAKGKKAIQRGKGSKTRRKQTKTPHPKARH